MTRGSKIMISKYGVTIATDYEELFNSTNGKNTEENAK